MRGSKFRKVYQGILISVALLMVSCQSGKYLSDGAYLYGGASVETAEPKSDQPGDKVKDELLTKIQQTPNKKFKLWVYRKFQQKEKGLGGWIKRKLGQVPVLYRPELTERSRRLMEQHLQKNGYLHASVNADTIRKKQKIQVVYQVNGKGRYFINDYILPPDSTELLTLINEPVKRPLIRSGRAYAQSTIDAERIRIETLARNHGFYEFDQTDVFFYLDTALQEKHKMDVYLTIRPPANQKNYKPHQLGNLVVYPDFSISDSETFKSDTIRDRDWTLIQNQKIIRLKALREAIAQDSSEKYSQELERQAINYLLDLGVFKFVNLKYQKRVEDGQPVLDRYCYLTPSLNQDVGLELEASTERTNFLGSSIGVQYTHRNLFRGAEQFQTGLSAGAELQAGGGGPFFNTFEINYDAGLTFPRLLLPFKALKRPRSSIPKTRINFNANYQQRNTLFTSMSLLTELSYNWKMNSGVQHSIYPLQFTLLDLINTSDEFEEELLLSPRLRASFNDLLILAALYRFSYTNQQISSRKNFFYLSAEFETAGNLGTRLGDDSVIDGRSTKTLFGLPVAQFARTQLEGRYTFYQKKTSIASRLNIGFALPYGNSIGVPYVRQFFVGGASSIRAFRFRGIGPGSYNPDPDQEDNINFFDRVGDIKLEGNVEYRFPIFGYLKGAAFIDAGNVWLSQNSAEELPEGRFELNDFYKEIAIGVGFGFRLDVEYLVLRFDFGIPVRDPSLQVSDRWLFRDIALGSKSWRQDNLTFNLAIGYPF